MDPVTTAPAALQQLRDALQCSDGHETYLPQAVNQLNEVSAAAREAAHHDLADFASMLARLLQVVLSLIDSEDTRQEAGQVQDFVCESLECLEKALQDDPDARLWMAELSQQAEASWGDCLQLIAPGDETYARDWSSRDENTPDIDMTLDTAQIGKLLESIDAMQAHEPAPPKESPANDPTEPAAKGSKATAKAPPKASAESNAPEDGSSLLVAEEKSSEKSQPEHVANLDAEIREAFLDDAQRCLASIESSLLAYEADPSQSAPLKQVCRELHTLKGASASVGLSKLANFLHQVEDELQAATEQEGSVDLQPIFRAVDAVREQVNPCIEVQPSPLDRHPAEAPETFVTSGSASQDSVRVKSAQLDRLMDMLAELVMLRNRRESRVERLKNVHNELIRCVSRLRTYEEGCATLGGPTQATSSHSVSSHTLPPHTLPAHSTTLYSETMTHRPAHETMIFRPAQMSQRVSSLTEVANDLLEIGGGLRELYDPVGDENLAISRFIRQFRQELIQLRRVPISGLFQRLQRAARDAARVEGKKVRLQTLGDDVGLESSLQQQLYEPLMHIVRNAVSHGIESESQRVACGKPPTGTVTLEAHGGANLMVITVRDDGRGLDYDALRRRGVEMGLIAADRHTSRAELARLIFHPGFSTRSVTNEISGRGVGMDVVASALERIHSWIEVDSVPGRGTSVRLLIPLRSVIEHVMVFRAGGQEFGIPTQFIRYAGSAASTDTSDYPLVHIAHIFEQLDCRRTTNPQLFVLARGWKSNNAGTDVADVASGDGGMRSEQRLGILVDEIVGPEEVVVRPLPNLLAQQPIFTGATLSGTGDIMLLFDAKRLLESCLAAAPAETDWVLTEDEGNQEQDQSSALIVDDSRSSRRTLAQILRRRGFKTVEAVDGMDALRQLKTQTFDVIFTDLEMPQLNGLELLREIRANTRTAEVPVVIVSSRGEESFRRRARELGVTDYITKPVPDAVIMQILARLEAERERTPV
jgi:chemotaxis protein histidine kinase CheA/ActR/RegA family two-component response regulator